MLIGVAALSWFSSQRDSDLRDATPITVSDARTGLQITTDPRTLTQNNARLLFARVTTMMAHRQPLPDPNGLVDASGNPVQGSIDQARKIVQKANDDAQAVLDSIGVGAGGGQAVVSQSATPVAINPDIAAGAIQSAGKDGEASA